MAPAATDVGHQFLGSGQRVEVGEVEGRTLQVAQRRHARGIGEGDVAFAERLLRDGGIAAIPLSPFYREPTRLTLLRFCFAKRDETLDAAAAALRAFAARLAA